MIGANNLYFTVKLGSFYTKIGQKGPVLRFLRPNAPKKIPLLEGGQKSPFPDDAIPQTRKKPPTQMAGGRINFLAAANGWNLRSGSDPENTVADGQTQSATPVDPPAMQAVPAECEDFQATPNGVFALRNALGDFLIDNFPAPPVVGIGGIVFKRLARFNAVEANLRLSKP
ncbi:MAG: hypothetical protein JJU11_03265 [Candidatus Sumerlaeia bacterium]|nr:hypothetical protein [Candidatus Sumerlaeia bacterium]